MIDPLLGRKLSAGRIEIIAPRGAGGMGQVYRGFHRELNVPVAIKVLPPRNAEPELAKRLRFEATALRMLDHPNAVKLYESGFEPDGLFFMAMEFIEGRDLAHLTSGGRRLDVRRACTVMSEALQALEAAHALRILHRDIKPGNIMLTRVRGQSGVFIDQVKVVDFGLAKLTAGDATQLTASGFTMGTPGFMSPEQAMGDPLDARTDVYACGATLYRLLSGSMAFKGEQVAALMQAMKSAPPAISGVPTELNRVVRWAMEPEAPQRCPSAKALNEALREWVDRGGLAHVEEPDGPLVFQLEVGDGAAAPKRAPTVALKPIADSPEGPAHAEARPPTRPEIRGAPREEPSARAPAVMPGGRELAPTESVRPPTVIRARPAPAPRAEAESSDSAEQAAAVDKRLRDAALHGAAPYEFVNLPERRTSPLLWVLGGMALVAVPGLLFFRTSQKSTVAPAPPPPRQVEVIREKPLEGTEELLLLESARLRPTAQAARLVSRALAAYRLAHPLPFEHAAAFELAPSTWLGTEGTSALSLVIEAVHPPFFTGSLSVRDLRVGVRGIFDGNDLLFDETIVLEGDGRWYQPVMKRFASIENGVLKASTGLDAKQMPMLAKPGAGILPALPKTAALAYIHWRSRVHDAIDQQLAGEAPSTESGALEPCPLGAQQREAFTAVIDGLFVFQVSDRVRVFRDGTPATIDHARARYGSAFVDSVLLLEPEMIEAWGRSKK